MRVSCVSHACVRVQSFCPCLHFYSYSRTIYVYYVYSLFYFDIAFTHFVEKMGTQNIENSEKDNAETKREIKTERVLSNQYYGHLPEAPE